MKLLEGVFVTQNDGDYVAVTVGKAGEKFSGMIRMNGSAAYVVNLLQTEQTEDSLVEALLAEYDVSDEVARANVRSVVEKLQNAGLLLA